ncbi:MAG: cyclopropane-fatty-acyl-phospholipid synthase family protein [Rhodospirillum sp.]|nr:cyclopropane-fatty-acyl-phospholipid synthase family protein [Rhodospirillum sp.]MCF8487803.1 cyclopropane-fatty-acyl-phospholipid synthase family protein [Rhodospirillum sp.]MCF8499901.1 cyclopropane-fatty-acyl-phospholipid synthase family protein [Rhodospirillum sp.]
MLFARFLKDRLSVGRLVLRDASGATYVMEGSVPGPDVAIRLTDPKLHHRLLLHPHLAVGEAYMDGTLIIEKGDLRTFMDLLGRNLAAIEAHPLMRLRQRLSTALRWVDQHNPVGRAQRNVAHHYDLSGALYDLFLDDDRQYSCAYYTSDTRSLEQAQANKKTLIATKLLLEPGQHVLDIGCGWGGMALTLARDHGARVTGVTLSKEQLAVAQRRAKEEGLSDRVTFRLQDYRDLTEPFDRIVSVGMLEHVGAGHLREYFSKVRDLLTEDGVALIHSIGRMEPPGSTNPWLRKYIFPGGYTPALSETMAAVETAGGLYATDVEILRLHYAHTLANWHARFTEQAQKAEALYDVRFRRMWEFYLVGCEAAFRHWNQMVFHLQLAKRQDAVPLTRDYLLDGMPKDRVRSRSGDRLAAE